MSGRRRHRDQSPPEGGRHYYNSGNMFRHTMRGPMEVGMGDPFLETSPEKFRRAMEAIGRINSTPANIMPLNNIALPPPPPPSDQVPATLQGLVNDWRSVLENKDLADFTIKCGSSTIKVHSLVLAVRSPVFKAMLQHNTVETRNREVIIDDMESDTLEAMLEYMYCSKVKLDDLEFSKACQLAAAADKYGLIELKDACFQHLFKDINLQNAGDLMILARRYSGPKEFLKKALDFCTKNFKDLRKDPEFKDVMKECLDEFFVPDNN